MSVTEQSNINLRPSQRELLLFHQKLGHAGFHWCQRLCAQPREPTQEWIIQPKSEHTTTCAPPMCAACQLAKQRRRFPQRHSTDNVEPMAIRQGDLRPGDCISIDQYISALPGRFPHTKGKESKAERYNGGTLFVDHSSGLVFLRNQVSLTTGSTLRSKKQFEAYASQFGIKVKRYRADNVPFSSQSFLQNIKDNDQTIDFSGTGAHHQHGVAERSIQTITRWARAMLLHAVLMWPDQDDLSLWPFATAPVELFSSIRCSTWDHLRRLHVWGCPSYVLDPRLQDGKKIPKWQPRSRRGQYLGVSLSHSSTIGRILNLSTGYVSPQYHVVYDDQFTSVPNSDSGGIFQDRPFDADSWDELIRSGLEHIFDPDNSNRPPLHDDWLTPQEQAHRRHHREQRQPLAAEPPPVLAPEGDSCENRRDVNNNGPNPSEGALDSNELSLVDHNDLLEMDPPVAEILPSPVPPAPNLPTVTTRSGRHVKQPKRLIENMFARKETTIQILIAIQSEKFDPSLFKSAVSYGIDVDRNRGTSTFC